MTALRQFIARVRSLFRRRQVEREMAEEMRFHLQEHADEQMADGLAPDEARYAAQRKFGNMGLIQDAARDERNFVQFDLLLQDVARATRALRKNPGFAGTAVLILGLGIAACVAIFSVVHPLLLSPLQYRKASELVQVQAHHEQQGDAGLAPAAFGDLATRSSSFASLAAQYYYYVNVTGIDTPTLINSAEVTPDYFTLFGIAPFLGRTWSIEETNPSATPVVVLSHKLWRGQFSARESIIGRQIMLDDVAHTVIGVMGPSFKDPAEVAQMWRPIRAGGDNFLERTSHYWTVFGRLKAGVAVDRANAELAGIAAQLAQAYPKTDEGWSLRADDLRRRVTSSYHTGLLVLLGAVGCVILITCANVAGLNLVRATVRRRELAIRTALGATRAQLLRQLLAESLVLSALGGAVGLLLGNWSLTALLTTLPEGWLPRADEIALDLPVIGVALALTVATGLAFGLAPGLIATRVDANDALKDQARGSASRSTRRLRSGLVVTEIALALMILVGATLLGRSFINLLRVESGLDEARLLTLTVSLSGKRYATSAKRLDFYARAEAEVAEVPGVQAAGFTQTSPFRWGIPVAFAPLRGDDAGTAEIPTAFYDSVSLDYFKAIGTPLLAGRFFAATDDANAQTVVILSQTAARRYFGAEDPLGRFLVAPGVSPIRFEVVGVVGDVRRLGLSAAAPLQVYCPLAQRPPAFGTLMLRTALPPAALANAAQAALWRIDPEIPVSDVAPMDTLVGRSIAQPRLYLILFGAFAVIAVLLAGIGLYGSIAYSVAQRTQEFGIRTALGASPRNLLALVLREGAALAGLGVALGVIGAFIAARLLRAMVFATSVYDPVVFAAGSLAVAVVALLACWLPARRATHVNPLVALRAE